MFQLRALDSLDANKPVPLTPREAASGIFGSVSLTCWIFLLLPQLVENYRNGNAEAISLLFLFVWLVGDITNLIGSVWAGLVPLVITIAVYFCLADAVLIGQCMYYKLRNARRERSRRPSSIETPDPTTPLLGWSFSDSINESQNQYQTLNQPGARRRSSVSAEPQRSRDSSQAEAALAKFVEERQSGRGAWLKNFGSVLAICVVGIVGWVVAWQAGIWSPAPVERNGGVDMAAGAQVFGYVSALSYLGARLPQIYKNYSEKSCEGLSLLFFILSLLGNLTYGAGIICHSTEKNYIITNIPWLIGSLGTMVEDVTIFCQFRIYGSAD